MQLARVVRRLGILAASTVLLALPGVAQAQIGSERYASVVLDGQTGQVLFGSNADAPRHPASLTKMMTLYMVFDALRSGRLSLDQRIEMTPTAAARPPSKLGLPPGRTISVENGIYALVTKSANDVASLFGETLGGGDEQRFAQLMTLRARALGMTGTTFRNASGLPDIEQITTAHDMATLGRRLQHDFPERYHYFGTRTHQMGNISLRNHNRMLGEYEGVDGIKTGYINASGFNIVTSARRENTRLVVAVFGGNSWVERDRHAGALLDRGFSQMGVGPGTPGLMANAGAAASVAATGSLAAAAIRRVRGPALIARAAAAEPPASRRVALASVTPVKPRPGTRAAVAAAAPGRRTVVEQGDGGSRVRAAAAARPAATRVATPVRAAA
ncbi:D-alanyl-D-alanine carboxypeptidase family protein, partial [Roseomonas sp. 18066]|uniref:D-alanyl-D-alanine carboxypeptidase family protein n=1 Tax=Roseomonas sp. 18066 TaxID=2681412 RepID=UPI001358AF74